MEGLCNIDTIDEIEAKSVEADNVSNTDSKEELKKSTINLAGLLGPTHPGRPANEEPHVKKFMKNKKEKIELICRIDQDELGFQEDDYDDLKALFVVCLNCRHNISILCILFIPSSLIMTRMGSSI